MSSLVFAVLAGWSCFLSLLLFLPPRGYGVLQLPYFILTFMWGELALYNILLQALSLLFWIWLDAIEGLAGVLGMALLSISWLALYVHHRIGHHTPALLEAALKEGLGCDSVAPIRRLGGFGWMRPFVLRDRRCSMLTDIPYSGDYPENKLDIYLPEAAEGPYPVLLYVHGGAFFMGDKRQQGRLLYQHAVDAGWAVVSINYRLGPDHRMPAMIVDTKRAVAWLHQHGEEYGLNSTMIVSAGESAGGFLSLMLACTPGDPFFQPGFEDVDTRLQGCISLYAPNDLLGEHGCFDAETYQEFNLKHVMPVAAGEDPELWRRCSPMYRLSPDMPPVFVLGGTHDPLASLEETLQLSSALQSISRSAVVSAIYPNTTHAFDQTRSSRSIPTMQALLQFMNWVRDSSASRGEI